MNSELYEKLYRNDWMQVYSYLCALSHDRSLVEELTQETFFRAFRSSDGFRSQSEETTWLCAIAKNLYTDEMRRRARYRPLEDGALEALPDEEDEMQNKAADADLSFRIHRILHTLPEPYREVFMLRVFGELSFAQIGTVFQKTESWARVTYHRARLRIQKEMG